MAVHPLCGCVRKLADVAAAAHEWGSQFCSEWRKFGASEEIRTLALISNFRINSAASLGTQQNQNRIFFEEVQEWLARGGGTLFFAHDTYAAIKTSAVRSWARLSSKRVASELELIRKGKFDFQAYSYLLDDTDIPCKQEILQGKMRFLGAKSESFSEKQLYCSDFSRNPYETNREIISVNREFPGPNREFPPREILASCKSPSVSRGFT